MRTRDIDTALRIFRDKGGTVRTRDLIALGVHKYALYALCGGGQVTKLGSRFCRLIEIDEDEHPDLAAVAAPAPNAAACLISALSHHEITTQVPSAAHLADRSFSSDHSPSLRS